jgi:hypothetical protein
MGKRFTNIDVFVLLSHLAIGLMAAFAVEFLQFLHLSVRITVLVLYLGAAWMIYSKIRQLQRRSEELEIEKWERYQFLSSRVLDVVGEFIKDRYKINHNLAREINDALDKGMLTQEAFQGFLDDFSKFRRVQIKTALSELSTALPRDTHKKPLDADSAVQDRFKISFYAVEYDSEIGEKCLLPKWRYYPNESEPRTKRFREGEGVAGLAWSDKRIKVCETGGENPHFKDMWEGGGQKEQYASMICVPAIEDIPAEKMTDVYGVLTVDTPIRRGYFEDRMAQFWADLFEPICNLLIYCHEIEKVKEAVSNAIQTLVKGKPIADGS